MFQKVDIDLVCALVIQVTLDGENWNFFIVLFVSKKTPKNFMQNLYIDEFQSKCLKMLPLHWTMDIEVTFSVAMNK